PAQVSVTYNGVRRHLRALTQREVLPVLRRLNVPPQYILYVGTLEPRKNTLILMQAYCALPAAYRECHPLLLVGKWGWNTDAESEYYAAAARHRGVRHMGYVKEHQLPALYSGARVLAFPSFYEGFGLPPVEMLACGGAVIASDIPVLREVLRGKA